MTLGKYLLSSKKYNSFYLNCFALQEAVDVSRYYKLQVSTATTTFCLQYLFMPSDLSGIVPY